jgi:TRAP-type mannitol/chloroaromatic compound transport system permease large subunit
VNSMIKAVYNRLIADGVISGTVSGTVAGVVP